MASALKRLVIICALIFVPLGISVPAFSLNIEGEDDPASSSIIDNYLAATRGHEDDLRGASMQVEIRAFIPKLKENGTLQALRKISKVGQVTYRVLSFQGDKTVKNQVIVRYLEAEQQGQGDSKIDITPENYKFKYRGLKETQTGEQAHVFQLSPRKKKVGLFKGELWLDPKTYLPLLEKGRLVKNPSIFFKKVDFERAFHIRDGLSVPEQMTSTIDTRLIGKVELQIRYSKFSQNSAMNRGEVATPVSATAAANAVGFPFGLCQ